MSVRSLQELYDFALTLWNLPYIWGGEGAGGYDCSGLVQRILKAANLDPKGDQTAHGLYEHFLHDGIVNQRGLGALAFFGSPQKIHHIGWCVDTRLILNASGGGRSCLNAEEAKRMNAYVKIEPIAYRKDLVAIIMPFYQLPAS